MATIASIATTTVASPLGNIELYGTDRGLCALEFKNSSQTELLTRRFSKWFGEGVAFKNSEGPFEQSLRWLELYFAGKFAALPNVTLDLRGSEFELGVWREMLTIKAGETLPYSTIAQRLGNANASRAVGNASRRNPVGLIVPCHRVVGANGALTGYAGGLDRKAWLVNHEVPAALFELAYESQGLQAQT